MTERVLLVEVDGALADSWTDRLLDAGWRVERAASAADARALEPPDVLVTESELPDGAGLALVRELRRRRPTLRALLVGASMAEPVPRDVGVLVKPFPAETMASTVADLPAAIVPGPFVEGGPPRAFRSGSAVWIVVAVALVLVGAFGVWWLRGEEALPEPRRASALRGSEANTLAPRGDVENAPELRWSRVEDASRYVVWVRRLDGSVLWQTSTVTERAELSEVPLRRGTPYRWEVEAFDASGRRLSLSAPTDFRIRGEDP